MHAAFSLLRQQRRRRIAGQCAAPTIRGGFAFIENGLREAGHSCRELIDGCGGDGSAVFCNEFAAGLCEKRAAAWFAENIAQIAAA
jgi:hypothetical protein